MCIRDRCNPSQLIKYIGRYLGRPVIATSRIDSYDGVCVTFHYNRHEDNQLITETIYALDFISRLTQHIPEKHFKMIRYYGIYARHRQSDLLLRRAISKEKHKIYLSFNLSLIHIFSISLICSSKSVTKETPEQASQCMSSCPSACSAPAE